MRLEVSVCIILWNISQNIICSGKSAVNHIQSIKTNQDRSGSISLLQANKWALGSEKNCCTISEDLPSMLAHVTLVSADDATTSTSP